jgi:xylulokinase
MNLLDLKTKTWSDEILRCSALGLAERLGTPLESHKVVGSVANYFVKKYHFSSSCQVVAFAGDNPNSVVGMRLANTGDISISLGTSDTLFGTLDEPRPSAHEGHIFCNPAHPSSFMALVCYKNGSLTREDVRNRVAHGSWEEFEKLLAQGAPGNNGHIGFFFKEHEITPQG